jgi:Holliday junction resolvase RusA-like endonuclease
VKTTLTLPFPPSVNSLYDGGKNTNRRFISDRYKRWQEDAGYSILNQRDRRHRHVGPVQVTYTFTPPDKRRRDAFNFEKAVSDFLVKHQIIADDCLIMRGTVQWMTSQHPVLVVIQDIEDT